MTALDYFSSCQMCGWSGFGIPEVNRHGEHLSPEGGTCPGPVLASPPPNAKSDGIDEWEVRYWEADE